MEGPGGLDGNLHVVSPVSTGYVPGNECHHTISFHLKVIHQLLFPSVQPQKFNHAASFDMMATFAYINSITAIIVYDWHIFVAIYICHNSAVCIT